MAPRNGAEASQADAAAGKAGRAPRAGGTGAPTHRRPGTAPGSQGAREKSVAQGSASGSEGAAGLTKLVRDASLHNGEAGSSGASAKGASASRAAGRSARYASTPGPGAYTPEGPLAGRFSIGARRSTSTEQMANSEAYKPGPGEYKNEARWDHVGAVNLGATAGRDKPPPSLPADVAAALRPQNKPGPGAYTLPSSLSESSFRIGKRGKTSIAAEADAGAKLPAPGDYQVGARWNRVGSVSMGATSGRDKPVASVPPELVNALRPQSKPGPGAYTLPSSLSESSFRIGKRDKTSIAAEAEAGGKLPGPGQYKVDVPTYLGAVKLGATSGRERNLDASGVGKPGPGAYTPELPGSTAFSIGTRRKTSIEEEASKGALLPGPGAYKNDARWDHVGGVNLGATAGRDKPVASVPGEVAAALRPQSKPGPGAYTLPSTLSESSFRIGKREKTCIAAEADANAAKPGPGEYVVGARWNRVGSVSLGATSGRDKPGASVPAELVGALRPQSKPGPGAYTLPSSLSESSFRIGKRDKTSIAAEADAAKSKPGPGQYSLDVRTYVGAVKLGATSGRERSLDSSAVGKPGPGAYTPELPGSTAFSIGTRRKTSIDEEASKAALLPGPGLYRNDARWARVGRVSLGGTSGRDRPIPATPNNPNCLSNLAPP